MISIAAGLGLVAAPIISAVTAAPASAETTTTAIGTLVTNSGLGLTSLADNPVHIGDVLVVGAEPGATTPTLTSVTGGGVTTWTKAVGVRRYDSATRRRDLVWDRERYRCLHDQLQLVGFGLFADA